MKENTSSTEHILPARSFKFQMTIDSFQKYYNDVRGHEGVDGTSPGLVSNETSKKVISIDNYRSQKECRGLYQLPLQHRLNMATDRL